MQWSYALARAPLAIVAWTASLPSQTVPPKLTLDAAVELALGQRREIDSAEAAVRGRQGAEIQASLKPNPMLSFQSENWRAWQAPGFSAHSDLDLFAYLSETIETGGKRRLRTAVAETHTRTAELERKVVAWAVRREVSEAWWRAIGAADRRDLLEESRETLGELVRFQQARLELGAIGEIDVIKVRVEDERLAAAVAGAAADLEQARLRLLSAMGMPQAQTNFEIAGKLETENGGALPALEDVVRQALESRPDLAVERAVVASAQAAVDLERAQAKPNLTPYFGYKKSGVHSTLIGGVSVPLPIRDRNQGRIAEALAEVDRAESNLRAMEARARAETRAASADADRRRAIVASIREGVRERATETFRIARDAYEEQGVDLLFLLDAQRSRNEIELLYAQSLLDYRLSQERLAAATGYALSVGGAQ
jgi:cobalt-zinc-cadmium efflux system outer membrane protein